MTFTVVQIAGGSEKVLGTVWASAQAEAETIASNLFTVPETQRHVVLRREEEREIPMKPFN